MDARQNIDDDEASHGGTGKSLFIKSFQYLIRCKPMNGRFKDLLKNQYIYHGVSEHTDMVHVEDTDRYLDMGFFYNAISSDLDVNPKWGVPFTIPYQLSPKFVFTSNFPPRGAVDSTLRRLVFCMFSDYFHENVNGHYESTVQPKDELGVMLFSEYEFSVEQWNLFYNFMVQCLSFYLSTGEEKINPPGNSVVQRTLLNVMGNNFKDWADVYFSEESGNLDRLIVKQECFDLYSKQNNTKITQQYFKKSLIAWCELSEYDLNPKQLQNSGSRIIKKIDGVATEMIYIKRIDKINNSQSPVSIHEPTMTENTKDDDVF
ncbi:MAG: hypothetical protein HYZ42_18305 [Bacteroidetes bacterium]|nr:hypothetical protein [Bacteroidota bacterium]